MEVIPWQQIYMKEYEADIAQREQSIDKRRKKLQKNSEEIKNSQKTRGNTRERD